MDVRLQNGYRILIAPPRNGAEPVQDSFPSDYSLKIKFERAEVKKMLSDMKDFILAVKRLLME